MPALLAALFCPAAVAQDLRWVGRYHIDKRIQVGQVPGRSRETKPGQRLTGAMVNGNRCGRDYTPGMAAEVSGIILVAAFAAAAFSCALLILKLWRARAAAPRPPRDS